MLLFKLCYKPQKLSNLSCGYSFSKSSQFLMDDFSWWQQSEVNKAPGPYHNHQSNAFAYHHLSPGDVTELRTIAIPRVTNNMIVEKNWDALELALSDLWTANTACNFDEQTTNNTTSGTDMETLQQDQANLFNLSEALKAMKPDTFCKGKLCPVFVFTI